MLRLDFHPKNKDAKIFEKHIYPVMLVFVGHCYMYTYVRVSVILKVLLHYFVLAKLATSSRRFNVRVFDVQVVSRV